MPKKQKVPPRVKDAIRGEFKEPSLADLASHFFACAGGTKAVARMLFDEFAAAKQGSIIRQRILEMVLRVTKAADDKMGPAADLGMLTEADLEAEIEAILGRASGGEKEGAGSGGPAPVATAEEGGGAEAAPGPAADAGVHPGPAA